MKNRNPGYISDVDELIAKTSVANVLSHFQLPVPDKTTGEHRLPCVFNADCHDSSYGALSIRLDDAANSIYCHSCQTRGNLLTLLHGLQHHHPPTGDKLRGQEFKDAVTLLREIAGQSMQETLSESDPATVATGPSAPAEPDPPLRNIPLVQREKTRELANLHEDLVTDPADMPPDAAAYFRKRPWLTPEVCRKWRMGYLPKNGRSLFRGQIVYAHRSESGAIISYSGRDASFDQKWQKWIAAGRPEKKRPMKHRFVKGFHKGIELYGQHTDRMQEPTIRKSLVEIGLVVVEGMNDVIRLDCLGVATVALTTHHATEEQLEKLTRFAQHAANKRIVLMPDNDGEADEGFRNLMWELACNDIDVRLAWSSMLNGGQFDKKQPEDITESEWQNLLPGLSK